VAWLREECGLDDAGAEQVIEYIVAGRAVLGAVPTQTTIIAERFFDEGGGMQLVIHAPFGGRINKAWGLALRKRFCTTFNFELQAAATDEGINISLAEQHSFPVSDVFHYLRPESAQPVLEQAVLASPIFTTRWRWAAGRALALLRFQSGKKVPPQIQRMRAEDLLASVFPDVVACQENVPYEIKVPEHPLVREAMKDTLTEAMDLEGLKELLRGIADGRIRCLAVDTPVPSHFSHEILNANPYAYLDDAPLEERRARAVEMRRVLPDSVLAEVGRLDPAAIAEVRASAWPDVRDPDELHDALLTLVALPARLDRHPSPEDVWADHFAELMSQRRAARAIHTGITYWVAAERAKTFAALFPTSKFETQLPDVETRAPSPDDALPAMVTGWMTNVGPIASAELARTVGLPFGAVEQALLRLEASGLVLRGRFTPDLAQGETEWCERRLLARIHRLTLGALRREIEPVTSAQFMRWLFSWQHVAPGTQLAGERGVLEALRQLQGFEAPASAWEQELLRRRVVNYDPKFLDQLCLTGALGWGRLSPHPATLEVAEGRGRRVVPTSVAPITFFVREESDWMIPQRPESDLDAAHGLSHGARSVHDYLRLRGASFFADIVRGAGRLKSEVETALWELVAAGLVTADGFDNLRALIDPKRRAGQGSGRHSRPRHSSGRWSLLYAGELVERNRAVEAICSMLLGRYGLVFRELVTRESVPTKWRELLIAFRRLEDRGELRGGRFVDGFIGEQFALPVAVESLRAMRKVQPAGQTVIVSTADPLNLVGIIVPGERMPATSGKLVAFTDGAAVPAAAQSRAVFEVGR
jgi:ATP-dependent Lhr-like helicase